MRIGSITTGLAILVAGAFVSWRIHSQAGSLRRGTESAEQRTATVRAEIEKRQTEIGLLQRASDDARSGRNASVAQLSKARAEHISAPPKNEWSEPPAAWPEWEEKSPYVWIDKELLKKIPITPFESSGAITPRVGAMLALSPDQQRGLNNSLDPILREKRKLEVEAAQISTNHLESGEGEKITVIVTPDPERNTELRQRFEDVLRTHLAPKQAELLRELGRHWLAENFQAGSADPKTISAVRHPDGSYGVTVKGPNQWYSAGGFLKLEQHVPSNLLPLFSPIMAPQEFPSQTN